MESGTLAIPPLGPDGLLPPSVHNCTFREFEQRFGFNERRKQLIANLREILEGLPGKQAIAYILVNGSFVQDEPLPSDVDVILVVADARDDTPAGDLARYCKRKQRSHYNIYSCEIYVCDETFAATYWVDKFGKTRPPVREKGLLRIEGGRT